MVRIRPYILYDCKEIMQLFYDTVHVINKKDYTEAQLNAWAPEKPDEEHWEKVLREHYSIVAELDNQIVGFSDMDDTGYLDHLFVHKDYQGQGIGTALLNKLESYAFRPMNSRSQTARRRSLQAEPSFRRQKTSCQARSRSWQTPEKSWKMEKQITSKARKRQRRRSQTASSRSLTQRLSWQIWNSRSGI